MLPPVYPLPSIPRLDDIAISTPCTVSWAGMEGNERVRFCNECKLPVYNFSLLMRSEIEALLGSHPDRLCARLYRRSDGKIMTKECPTGRMRRIRRILAMPIALLAIFTGIFFCRSSPPRRSGVADATPMEHIRQFEPFRTVIDFIDPPGTQCMGAIAPTSFPPSNAPVTSPPNVEQ
jgi:hypothetical protein